MKRHDAASGCDNKILFYCEKDKEASFYEDVRRGGSGGFILHRSRGGVDEYSELTCAEFKDLAVKAHENGFISYFKLRSLLKTVEPGLRADKNITSFETVTLRESGMRFVCDKEIVMKDGKAEVSYYNIIYDRGSDEDRRELNTRAVVDAADVLNVLNKVRLASWDGFHGAHPKNVTDGIMFSLSAKINGGAEIHAGGSENFPPKYRELTDWFYKVFSEADEKAKNDDGEDA